MAEDLRRPRSPRPPASTRRPPKTHGGNTSRRCGIERTRGVRARDGAGDHRRRAARARTPPSSTGSSPRKPRPRAARSASGTGSGSNASARSDRRAGSPGLAGLDDAVELLLSAVSTGRASTRRTAAELLLGTRPGLDAFASGHELAQALGKTMPRGHQLIKELQDEWAGNPATRELLDGVLGSVPGDPAVIPVGRHRSRRSPRRCVRCSRARLRPHRTPRRRVWPSVPPRACCARRSTGSPNTRPPPARSNWCDAVTTVGSRLSPTDEVALAAAEPAAPARRRARHRPS